MHARKAGVSSAELMRLLSALRADGTRVLAPGTFALDAARIDPARESRDLSVLVLRERLVQMNLGGLATPSRGSG